jgi:hypothetical protein
MQLYRSDNGAPIPHTEFPELFAVCRSCEPFLQFQILSIDQSGFSGNGGRYCTFIENERIRNTNFVMHNHENGPRDRSYMVGHIHAANRDADHYQPPSRVRFEVRRIFLETQNLRIPVVFIDPMSMLPKPKNLVIPINAERREREDEHFNHMLQNEVLNQNNYSYRNSPYHREYNPLNDYRGNQFFQQDALYDDDYEDPPPRLRERNRRLARGTVQTPPTRPRGDEAFPTTPPSSAAAGGGAVANTVQLSRFTVNAILNQAILEEMTCPISMARIEKGSAVVTGCQHVFQRDSITTWLTDHDTCPVCRARTSIVQIQI